MCPDFSAAVQRRRCLHRPLAFVAAVGDGCTAIVEAVAGGNVAGFIAHEHISPRPRRLHVQVRHLRSRSTGICSTVAARSPPRPRNRATVREVCRKSLRSQFGGAKASPTTSCALICCRLRCGRDFHIAIQFSRRSTTTWISTCRAQPLKTPAHAALSPSTGDIVGFYEALELR